MAELLAPFAGTIVAVPVAENARVAAHAPVAIIEAMKMEHEIVAEQDATIARLAVAVGDAVTEGQLIATLSDAGAIPAAGAEAEPDPESHTRADDPPPAARAEPTSRPSAPATRSASTPPGPTPWPSATSRTGAPRARTSPTCSTTARSSSTAR